MRITALTAGLFFLASHAHAQPSIAVEKVFLDTTHVKAIVRITNSDPRSYRLVGFRCTFFLLGSPVDSAGNVALNVAAGETVFERVIGPYKEQPVDSVQCRISSANR